MNSIIAWLGGKRLLRKKIIPLIPEHACYVEAFAGAAWVLFGKDPATSTVEIVNDINGDLVNLFLVVKHHPEEFLRELDLLSPSRDVLRRFRASPGLTYIQRAARFFYVIKTS